MPALNEKISQIREAEGALENFERDIVNSGRDFEESIIDEVRARTNPTLVDPAKWALRRQNEIMNTFDLFSENLRDYSGDLEYKINDLLDYLKTELVTR